jgi:AraC family transcriptional regulator, transcriptional activator of pobA
MQHLYRLEHTNAQLSLTQQEADFKRAFFLERSQRLLTIAWNRGETQTIVVDGVEYLFPANTILPLMVNQSFSFSQPQAIVAWQFNREFYCIVDHDKEVSCVGFLFYGMTDVQFLTLDEAEQRRFGALLEVFLDEFRTTDSIQAEMLRMLLKRLIIKLTRLAKEQHRLVDVPTAELDLMRRYNLLIEHHFRQKHTVADYADLLNRSPKTLTNLFAAHGQKSPLRLIHDRIMLEARRLLIYTDKNTKEIGYELGFSEANHFSRFFKKEAGIPPAEYKKSHEQWLSK